MDSNCSLLKTPQIISKKQSIKLWFAKKMCSVFAACHLLKKVGDLSPSNWLVAQLSTLQIRSKIYLFISRSKFRIVIVQLFVHWVLRLGLWASPRTLNLLITLWIFYSFSKILIPIITSKSQDSSSTIVTTMLSSRKDKKSQTTFKKGESKNLMFKSRPTRPIICVRILSKFH